MIRKSSVFDLRPEIFCACAIYLFVLVSSLSSTISVVRRFKEGKSQNNGGSASQRSIAMSGQR